MAELSSGNRVRRGSHDAERWWLLEEQFSRLKCRRSECCCSNSIFLTLALWNPSFLSVKSALNNLKQPTNFASTPGQEAAILSVDSLVLGDATLSDTLMRRFCNAFHGSPAYSYVTTDGLEQKIHVCTIGPATRFAFRVCHQEVRKAFQSASFLVSKKKKK
jgi:hypothetical protein